MILCGSILYYLYQSTPVVFTASFLMHCRRNNLTALHFAAHQNLTEIGLLLLQNSANPLAKDIKYVLVYIMNTDALETQNQICRVC